jgi:RimJ/RimL family protein N-acetyltransferase
MSPILKIQGIIRPLKDADLAEFIAHLLRLDPASRHDRFQGGMSDMAIMLYGEHALESKSIISGFYVDGILRGAAELKIAGDISELAFSIEKSFQCKGIGRTLLAETLIKARHLGLTEVQLSFLASNDAMRHIAQKLGAEIKGTNAFFHLYEGELEKSDDSLSKEKSSHYFDMAA